VESDASWLQAVAAAMQASEQVSSSTTSILPDVECFDVAVQCTAPQIEHDTSKAMGVRDARPKDASVQCGPDLWAMDNCYAIDKVVEDLAFSGRTDLLLKADNSDLRRELHRLEASLIVAMRKLEIYERRNRMEAYSKKVSVDKLYTRVDTTGAHWLGPGKLCIPDRRANIQKVAQEGTTDNNGIFQSVTEELKLSAGLVQSGQPHQSQAEREASPMSRLLQRSSQRLTRE
jgi:hypothetical protein